MAINRDGIYGKGCLADVAGFYGVDMEGAGARRS